jgi:hypothetical protein
MKVPANIISENLYTAGKEFVYANSYKEYQGYYYEINDRFFAGREFDPKAPLLLKLDSDDIDPLRLNPQTSTYAGLKRERIPNNRIPSIPLEPTAGVKYLAKQNSSNPIRIIFTTKTAWENSEKYPGYIFTSVNYEPEFGFEITEENKNTIPEIEVFLAEYLNSL